MTMVGLPIPMLSAMVAGLVVPFYMGSGVMFSFRSVAAIPACLVFAGCAGTALEPAHVAVRPAPYPVAGLVGSWGIASFREQRDFKRTEAMARAQCKLPYVITGGPTDGVMMHVADDPKLHELTLKGGPDGKTYLGFNSPPGDPQDREIISFTNDEIVMKFVDPDANTRYGTFVYVRCPAKNS
jgi:hypothetical protein